ncbi:MAG: hypothetical protein LBG10_09890 [Treponema sp.]|jgi:hypothetical protein|nr:hypothetical protein [Treponema sp.]
MLKKTLCLCFIGIFCLIPLFAQTRSLSDIFPRISPEIRDQAFSPDGFIKSAEKSDGFHLLDSSGLDPRLSGSILNGQPSVLVESLLIIPQTGSPLSLLEVYNALGNIRALKGRLYHSVTRNQIVPLFEDATRIAGAKKTSPIPDPGPASSVPASETVYLYIKDVNFGNSYYRGDISLDTFGLVYRLSNYRNLTYLFFPVIKEEKFIAQLYFEPITEGVLVYSIAGADVSDFVASKIDMPSAIAKRLAVIISWVVDGISQQFSF